MLALRSTRRRVRRGVTAVEASLVMSVFLLLLFGMFEYCRFLFVLHITHNAARDGARYAVVNLDKPSNFNTTDYTDASGTVHPSIQRYTTERMAGQQRNLDGFRTACFAVDQAGLDQNPPIIRPKTTSTASPKVYPDPFNPSDPNAVPWNSAIFTERIAVTIDGTYKPVLPTFLLMPSTIPVKVTAIMGSEG
ncbi:MAG: pilus assembly protein [Planctomycetia bacterium]|nr:pilus assembly protein [Planctomycetia bacterium]